MTYSRPDVFRNSLSYQRVPEQHTETVTREDGFGGFTTTTITTTRHRENNALTESMPSSESERLPRQTDDSQLGNQALNQSNIGNIPLYSSEKDQDQDHDQKKVKSQKGVNKNESSQILHGALLNSQDKANIDHAMSFSRANPDLPQINDQLSAGSSNSDDPNPYPRPRQEEEQSFGPKADQDQAKKLTPANLNIASQYPGRPEDTEQAYQGNRRLYYNQSRDPSVYQYPNEEYISLSRYQDLVAYTQSLEENMNKINSRIQILEDENADSKIERERAKHAHDSTSRHRKRHKKDMSANIGAQQERPK
ncbi:hypothetical protein PSN45_003321 [Yamadazyma tenuis]|nr:hypothetical protein PSN45_003321 [Yamadazyma tenuis]